MIEYVNNWHRVWSHRRSSASISIQDPLQQLIALNGFDSPLGAMSANDWKKYLGIFVERCGLAEADSIFEVGCGSGAFLYPLLMSGYQIGGLDYSKEMRPWAFCFGVLQSAIRPTNCARGLKSVGGICHQEHTTFLVV